MWVDGVGSGTPDGAHILYTDLIWRSKHLQLPYKDDVKHTGHHIVKQGHTKAVSERY